MDRHATSAFSLVLRWRPVRSGKVIPLPRYRRGACDKPHLHVIHCWAVLHPFLNNLSVTSHDSQSLLLLLPHTSARPAPIRHYLRLPRSMTASLAGAPVSSRNASANRRQGAAIAPPSSLCEWRRIWNRQSVRRVIRYAEIICVYALPATCILTSGTSRGTSRLALWRIGVGRNPAGLFNVEMCEQMTVSAPTKQIMGLAIPLLCIVTHRFQNRNPTFDWFPAPLTDYPTGHAKPTRMARRSCRRLFDYCTIKMAISASAPARRWMVTLPYLC